MVIGDTVGEKLGTDLGVVVVGNLVGTTVGVEDGLDVVGEIEGVLVVGTNDEVEGVRR